MTTSSARSNGWSPQWPPVTAELPAGPAVEPPGESIPAVRTLVSAPVGEAVTAHEPMTRTGALSALDARSGPALWAVLFGVVAAALLTLGGVGLGLGALAVVLAAAGAWRGFAPAPGPIGITVRSKAIDVVFYEGFAAAIAFLAMTVPNH